MTLSRQPLQTANGVGHASVENPKEQERLRAKVMWGPTFVLDCALVSTLAFIQCSLASSRPISAAVQLGHAVPSRLRREQPDKPSRIALSPDDHRCSDRTQLSGALTAVLDFDCSHPASGPLKRIAPAAFTVSPGAGGARRLLSLVPFDGGVNVLEDALQPTASHIFVRSSGQIGDDTVHNLVAQSSARRRLKQWQVIQFIVLVVDYGVAFDLRMCLKPRDDLIAPWARRHVGNHVNERNSPVFRTENASWVISPC